MQGFFEWFLESSLLVVLILGIRKIFTGRIRYVGIYALWLVVLLRFMIPVNFISTPFSVGNMISDTVSSWPSREASGQNGEFPDSVEESGNQQAETGRIMVSGSAEEVSEKAQQAKPAGTGEEKNAVHKTTEPVNWRFVFGSSWLWISGILFLWLIMSNVTLLRKIKRNRVLYGKKDKLEIYVTSGIKNPCLYGFFHPAIYLPRALVSGDSGVSASKEELKQVITHEYVHYRHGDHIWAMLRILLVSVYWFDPFLWLAVSCSKKDAELFCDETVVRLLGEEKRFCYGKMLVRLAGEASWGDFRYSMMAMSRSGKEMEKRIRALSEKRHYSKWLLIPLVVIVFAVGITCMTGIVTGETAFSSTGESKVAAVQVSGQTAGDPLSGYLDLWHSSGGEVSRDSSVYSGTVEEAFQHYVETFTDAVNTGNTDDMSWVLAEGSDVYEQQCNLVKNYYKRGIREEIDTCSISSAKINTPNQVEINSREKIKVFYGDDTTKLVNQQYRYTCEYKNQNWIITKMEEI